MRAGLPGIGEFKNICACVSSSNLALSVIDLGHELQHSWIGSSRFRFNPGRYVPSKDQLTLISMLLPKQVYTYLALLGWDYSHRSEITSSRPNLVNVFLHGFPVFSSQPNISYVRITIPLK